MKNISKVNNAPISKSRAPRSEKWKKNLSLALKGRQVWNKGLKGAQKAWNKKEISKDWLYQKYVIENKSANQTAAELKCSRSVVLRALKEFGIPKRTIDVRAGKSYAQLYGDRAEEIKKKMIEGLKVRKHNWGTKISKGLKEHYKNYSYPNEAKEQRKEIIKKLWRNPDYRKRLSEAHKGQLVWNKGKTGIYSEETKRKIALAHLGRKVIFSDSHRKKLSEASKRRFLEHREFLKQLARPHLTHVEKKIKDFLQQHFIEGQDFFYDEFDMLGSTLYRPDFQFPNQKVIIEVDGFYKHFTEKGKQRDEKRDEELRKAGWQIYRFAQKDVLKNFDTVKANILDIFNKPNEQNLLELT